MGIFDGRGLAAALSLGADGVWIGTRFIATPEARALPGYRETILETPRRRHRDLARVQRQDDASAAKRHHRSLRGRSVAARRSSPTSWRWRSLTAPSTWAATRHTSGIDPRREGYPAGQAVGAITSIVPAGDIVHSIVDRGTARDRRDSARCSREPRT